jgi:hypothetical protein
MPAITDSEKIEVLFNKSFGIATTLPTATIGQVAQDSAAEKIIPASQIYTQEIPSVAPTDLIEEPFDWPIKPSGAEEVIRTGAYAGGRAALPQKKYKSAAYPWIKKYENFQVLTEHDKVSYNGKVSPDNNILAHTIPFNQDRGGSYAIKVMVYDASGGNGGFLQFQRDDPRLSWNYDKDAGFITFYGDRPKYLGATDYLNNDINPIMTFWRYEGNFGLGTSPAGVTGPAGIAGPTGAKGERGDGATGAVGPTGPGGGGAGSGIYANDAWLISNLLGQSPPVVFGDPVRSVDTIYIPWSYPTKKLSPFGAGVYLPIIDRCTISITVDGVEYIIHANVNTFELITGQTTVLAIKKTPTQNGFGSDGSYTSVYKYYTDKISDSSLNTITVFYSNSLSPLPNPSSIQFSGFLPSEQIAAVTISGTAVGRQQLTALLSGVPGASQISYEWYRSGDATSIATGTTYTLSPGDVNKTITVIASYTDGNAVQKSVTSAATSTVTAPVNTLPTGSVTISGTVQVGQPLTAENTLADIDGSGNVTYKWYRSGDAVSIATGSTYTLVREDFDKTITVIASYTDGYNQLESKTSASTALVIAPTPNKLPTGSVSISGNAVGGQTLTAILINLADEDGLGTITYQWYRIGDAASIATGETYKLTPADVTKTITVIASYTDGYNRLESVTSNATATVTAPTNSPPTGEVTISGTAQVGQPLTANTVALVDVDGSGNFTYKWYSDNVLIPSATNKTYTPVRSDFEKTIKVTVSYTDGYGTAENVTSAPTAAVIAPANTLPTGSVTISGTARVGITLVAENTLADVDNLGEITYKWYRSGVVESIATGSTYTLVRDDFEKTITVTASYTDGYGRAESKTSAATLAVAAPPNNLPTGSVTISGTAVGGQTLDASNSLVDVDGSGNVTYKWYRDGVAISGATSDTYKLTPADVGKVITAIATYTDGYKYVENVISAPTQVVTRPANTPATGSVTISGTAVGGQTLDASNSLVDVDGLGTFAYQWYRAGAPVSNATNPTYILGPADVGNTITVTVSYTDGYGYAESKTSAATAAVTAPANTLPTGSITISGNTQAGQTLTATLNNLVDPDGIVLPIAYKWTRVSVGDIAGAINSTYVLIQDDVGKTITVTASYTDGYGRSESLTSSGTIIPAVAAPAEPAALTSISLNSGNFASNSSTIYRVLDRGLIGSVPLINAAQVATLQFNAPIHRLANIGTTGSSALMTLSASLNAGAGPSVSFSGFPATTPAAVTSNNITITPNSVTDYYAGQSGKTGYYLTSTDTIAVTPSAGSSVNALTATQTFSNATTASASATFYYDTPVTTAPTCLINTLSTSSTSKVSGLSILYNTSASINIDATANNMGKYFYRSPLITYNYTYGASSGTISETTLANVRTSDISNGNMFTNGALNFSSAVALTGITNTGYSTTPITINATANNIFGPSTITNGSFGIIMDPLSRTLVYQTQSTAVPTLTPTTTSATLTLATGAIPVPGARIWSAPITTTPSVPAGTICPDFSYNNTFYYAMPYDNNGSLTSTDPSGCKQDLLISNGVFSTPANNPNGYIDYSTYAGNAGLNYSTISATADTYRFATHCWKMPTMNAGQYTNLSFYIDSVYQLTRNTVTSIKLSNGNPLQVFYAFQNVDNPVHAANGWNSVWIRANATGTPSATTATYHTYSTLANRYGINQASLTAAGDQTALLAAGTAPFYKVFIPTYAITETMNVYLYLRIGLPMDKEMRFGKVYATLTRSS